MAIARNREELARQVGRVTSLSQALTPGVTVASSSLQMSPLQQRLIAQAREQFANSAQAVAIAQGAKAEPSGVMGLVAKVFDNPVAKTVLKPLEVLDVPRRALISGIHEISDAVGSGDASWSDFFEQTKDPSYGVGRYVDTGNKWVDRIIGFVGDVALDPLTYATLGAGQFAGAGGRTALAGMAADAGLSGEKIAKVARYGRAALDAADVERLGVNRAGVYWFGKRVRGLDRAGSATEKALTMIRLAGGDSAIGNRIRRAFVPDDFRELRLALMRGEVAPGRAKAVVGMVLSRDAERAAMARAVNEGQRRVAALAAEIGEADLRQYSTSIHRLLESDDLLRAATPREQEIAGRVKELLDSFWSDVDVAMKSAGTAESGFGRVANYFPHVPTRDGWEYMNDPTKAYSKAVQDLLVNPVDPARNFRSRVLEAGDNWFGHTLEEADLTVDRLNFLAKEGGFSGDFFETDFLKVADGYVNQYAKQMGIAGRLQDLADRGVLAEIPHVLKNETVYDTVALDAQRNAIARLLKDVDAARVNVLNSLQDAVDDLVGAGQVAAVGRDVAVKEATDAAAAATKAGSAVARRVESFERVKSNIARLRQQIEGTFENGVAPPAAQPYLAKLDEVTKEIERVQARLAEIASLEATASAEATAAAADLTAALAAVPKAAAVKEAKAVAADEVRAAAAKVEKTLAEAEKLAASSETFADVLAAATSGDFSGLGSRGGKVAKSLGSWLRGDVAQRTRRAELNKVVGQQGSVAQYIQAVAREQEWFADAVRGTQVSAKKVTLQSEETVAQAVVDLLDPTRGASKLADAHVAAVWQVAADDMLYGDNVPSMVAGSRRELLEAVKQADAALVKGDQVERVAEVLTGAADVAPVSVTDDAAAAAAESAVDATASRMQAMSYADLAVADEKTRIEWAISREFEYGKMSPREARRLRREDALAGYEPSRILSSKEGQRALLRKQKEIADVQRVDVTDLEAIAAREQADMFGRSYANIKMLRERFSAGSASDALTEDDVQALVVSLRSASGVDEAVLPDELATRGTSITDTWDESQIDASRLEASGADLSMISGDSRASGFGSTASNDLADMAGGMDVNAADLETGEFAATGRRQASDIGGTLGASGMRVRGAGLKSARQAAADSEYAVALQAALGDGLPETRGGLVDMLQRVEKAMLDRQFVVGDGNNLTSFTLDEFAREGGKGAARAKRAVVKADAAAAGVGALSKDAAARLLAEKLTEYRVISDIHQRFMYVAKVFGGYGAVPDLSVLRMLSESAVKSQVSLWESKVASLAAVGASEAEIAWARSMVSKLKAVSESPDRQFYKMLLDDVAGRVKQEAVAAAGAKPVVADVAGAAEKVRNIKANPRYMKAESDRAIVEALDGLAGRDMWLFTDPSGRAGFFVDGKPLLLSDGTPLQFNREEWQSLYRAAPSPEEISAAQKAAQDARAALEEVSRQKAKLQADYDKMRTLRAKRGGFAAAQEAQYKKLADDLASAGSRVREAQQAITDADVLAKSLDPTTQQAALEKIRVLVNGNGDQPGWQWSTANLDDITSADPAAVATRRAGIKAAWESTEEYRLLAEAADVAAEVEARKLEAWATDATSVAEHATRVDDAARAVDAEIVAESGAAPVADVPAEMRARSDAAAARVKELKAAGDKARKEEKRLVEQAAKLQVRIADGGTTPSARATTALAKQEDVYAVAEQKLAAATAVFDAAESLRMSKQAVVDTVVPTLEERISLVDNMVKNAGIDPAVARAEKRAPLKGRSSADAAKQLRAKALQPDVAELDAMRTWAAGARQALAAFSASPDDPLARVLVGYYSAEASLTFAENQVMNATAVLTRLEQGVDTERLVRVIEDGAEELDKIGLKGMMADKEIVAALTNMRKLSNPQTAAWFNGFLGKYTQFFKTYATLSPGFHVRNAMSNTIAVFAAGASPHNMNEGLRMYRSLIAHVKAGKAIEEWIAAQPAALRSRVEIAVRAMESAGGGRVEEAFADIFRKGGKVLDNKATRLSRRLGERVEGSARFMLAWDSAAKGMDFNSATARVKRYLFDYTDVGVLDKKLRNIVPFWIWTSRNLPMQIVNQWSQPRTYAIYNHLMQNLAQDDSGDMAPSWLREQGAVKIANGWYLAPDFGFSRLQQQVADFTDPRRLMSMVNPAIRLPVELMGGRKLYNDVPFSSRPQQVVGGGPVEALLSLLGAAKEVGPRGVRDRDGNVVLQPGEVATSDRWNYALMSLLPMLSQYERLAPSTDNYESRQWQSFLTYAGVPLRQVTPQMQESEYERRQRALNSLRTAAERMGYTP